MLGHFAGCQAGKSSHRKAYYHESSCVEVLVLPGSPSKYWKQAVLAEHPKGDMSLVSAHRVPDRSHCSNSRQSYTTQGRQPARQHKKHHWRPTARLTTDKGRQCGITSSSGNVHCELAQNRQVDMQALQHAPGTFPGLPYSIAPPQRASAHSQETAHRSASPAAGEAVAAAGGARCCCAAATPSAWGPCGADTAAPPAN